ncbi:MAG TPA: DUF2000 family protein [Patescibacteria group bacterium]|jgi:hypothetical protein|nr:DUF2000 family protein [Patescibacteria group bacterium]
MHDTKVGIAIRSDLADWQKLNVTAFLATGIAASAPESIGEVYEDASGNTYLPLISQPVVVYDASLDHLMRTKGRALSRGVQPAIYTEGMFKTFNDNDNRAVVKTLTDDTFDIVGIAIRADRKTFDKIMHGLKLHA